jgi:hypothetical protein
MVVIPGHAAVLTGCVRDYERLPASHEAMVPWAMVALMTQRLAQQR